MLNFEQIREYSSMMNQLGLIQYHADDRSFQITEKGRKMLDLLKQVGRMNEEIFAQ
jgi:predicted transcriptional regulator